MTSEYDFLMYIHMFSAVVNLKWGCALPDHPSPLVVFFMVCIPVYSLGDKGIK